MDYVLFEEFQKLDLRVGLIVAAERVAASEKLLKLRVDAGDHERQLVAGLGQYYAPEDLVGRRIVVIVNLEPKKFLGLESQGMLLAADAAGTEQGPVLLMPEKDIPAGSKIR